MSVNPGDLLLLIITSTFLLGAWLVRVEKGPDPDRIENIGLWAGAAGVAVVGIARLAGGA